MKSKIWIGSEHGFASYGELNGIIFSADTDEPLAEICVTLEVKNYDEVITYEINKIYENTEQTESELYAELKKHGKALLETEIVEHYEDLFEDGFSPDWGF